MYTSRRSRSLTLIHYSAAWADIDKYARDHGEFCGISTSSLNDITESHKRAVRVREDACGGRRALPLSAQPGPRVVPSGSPPALVGQAVARVMAAIGRFCSLIPGLGVKLSNDRPCRAHCSLRGRGERTLRMMA
jgi:hypothetical protein